MDMKLAKTTACTWLMILTVLVMPDFLAADPAIYRCGEAGSQTWSQIPCEEDSEALVVEDHLMFTEPQALQEDAGGVVGTTVTQQKGEMTQAKRMEAFIAQLETQRRQQLAEIDHSSAELESQMAASEDESVVAAAESALAELQSARREVVEQYDAMITEASSRVLSANN
jgi:hypothetical protein